MLLCEGFKCESHADREVIVNYQAGYSAKALLCNYHAVQLADSANKAGEVAIVSKAF